MVNVLSTLEAANILASGGSKSVFTTTSSTIATASTCVSPAVATASGSFPSTAIFTTVSVATPRVSRSPKGIVIESSPPISVNIPSINKEDKGKGIMTEPEKPSKEKVLDQMSAQLAKELEEEFALEYQRIREQAERDSKIARIHAQQELDMMIAMRWNLAQIKKYQAQQSKLTTKTKRRKFYMSVLRSNAGWKVKDFKGMTFEQIKEKFIPVWEKIQNFVSMNSKLESERLKRPGIQLDKERVKKLKTTEVSGTKPPQEKQTKEPKELSEEELKKMIEIVPAEEVYIEALQVKCPIIDWEVYSEGQIKYWKIVRVGDHIEVYQLFEEMLRKFDREDLDKLWSLVKENFSTTNPTEDKEKMLWFELKRLYEPDPRDQLWALQKYMHDPLKWKLYDTCGVHYVSTGRGHKIFILVEKDYPLTKGLTTVMLCNKLQVDQYSEMANELLMKIYSIANSPR
ncbi:hypothetical protein Tco_0808782 [Tanacetum coccineum]